MKDFSDKPLDTPSDWADHIVGLKEAIDDAMAIATKMAVFGHAEAIQIMPDVAGLLLEVGRWEAPEPDPIQEEIDELNQRISLLRCSQRMVNEFKEALS